MTGDYTNEQLTDGSHLHDAGGGNLGGTPALVSVDDSVVHVSCDSAADSPAALAAEEKRFDYKVERITSSVLVILCFTLNWVSAYSGHPQYCPDWLIGFMLGGFGAPVYQWIKDRVGNQTASK